MSKTSSKARASCADLYHEKQKKRYCIVHAINSFVGVKTTSCDELVKLVKDNPRLKRLQDETGQVYGKHIDMKCRCLT